MKRINALLSITTLIILFTSCSKELELTPEMGKGNTVNFQAVINGDKTKNTNYLLEFTWKKGDKAALFSINNSNIPFTSQAPGYTTTFSGTINNEIKREYSYLVFPYKAGESLDANRNYTFNLPLEQRVVSSDFWVVSSSEYDYMVGCSVAKNNNNKFEFHSLMAKMDFVLENRSKSPIKVKKITVSSANGEKIFSTTAKMKLSPDSINMRDYIVSEGVSSSLSIVIDNNTEIGGEKSNVVRMPFFPMTISCETELNFEVETDKGTYSETKRVVGFTTFTFERGESYLTSLTLK